MWRCLAPGGDQVIKRSQGEGPDLKAYLMGCAPQLRDRHTDTYAFISRHRHTLRRIDLLSQTMRHIQPAPAPPPLYTFLQTHSKLDIPIYNQKHIQILHTPLHHTHIVSVTEVTYLYTRTRRRRHTRTRTQILQHTYPHRLNSRT